MTVLLHMRRFGTGNVWGGAESKTQPCVRVPDGSGGRGALSASPCTARRLPAGGDAALRIRAEDPPGSGSRCAAAVEVPAGRDCTRKVISVPLQPLVPTSGPSSHQLGLSRLQRLLSPLLSHFKLKQFPLVALSTLSSFLFQRHLGPLNADGYTPEPVGKHL